MSEQSSSPPGKKKHAARRSSRTRASHVGGLLAERFLLTRRVITTTLSVFMAATDLLRRQHQGLLKIAQQLDGLLNPSVLPGKEAEARRVLSELVGTLVMHLAMEDQSMYPRLLVRKDPVVASKAKKFADEMGGLRAAADAYVARWTTAAAIAKDGAEFISETTGVLAALRARIAREDGDLYEMVDRLALK